MKGISGTCSYSWFFENMAVIRLSTLLLKDVLVTVVAGYDIRKIEWKPILGTMYRDKSLAEKDINETVVLVKAMTCDVMTQSAGYASILLNKSVEKKKHEKSKWLDQRRRVLILLGGAV